MQAQFEKHIDINCIFVCEIEMGNLSVTHSLASYFKNVSEEYMNVLYINVETISSIIYCWFNSYKSWINTKINRSWIYHFASKWPSLESNWDLNDSIVPVNHPSPKIGSKEPFPSYHCVYYHESRWCSCTKALENIGGLQLVHLGNDVEFFFQTFTQFTI